MLGFRQLRLVLLFGSSEALLGFYTPRASLLVVRREVVKACLGLASHPESCFFIVLLQGTTEAFKDGCFNVRVPVSEQHREAMRVVPCLFFALSRPLRISF